MLQLMKLISGSKCLFYVSSYQIESLRQSHTPCFNVKPMTQSKNRPKAFTINK